MLTAIQSADTAILLFVQNSIRCPALDVVMKAASFLGNWGLLWLALCVGLLVFAKTRRSGLCTLVSVAAEYAVCDLVIKKLVQRPRPYLVIADLQCLVAAESSTSFPSGHAASSFVCAYILTRSFGKKGAWAYVPAALIALSRIYVGVHYPSDVLCGALLGTLIGVALWPLLQRAFDRLDKTRGKKG